MKALNNTQTEKLNYYSQWCITIANFMSEKTSNTQAADYWQNLKLKNTKQDIKGMKAAFNDMTAWALYLDGENRIELNKTLRKQFSHDLFDVDKKLQKKVQSVIAKNKITNKEQYYLLREYYDRILDMEEYKDISDKINDLIYIFENKGNTVN